MVLDTPKYILDANISDTTLRYKWDDWDVQAVFQLEAGEFYEQMSNVSYRGNMAFIIACGEWVVHRFELLSDDPEPLDHMEASWAGMIDANYSLYWEPQDDEWIGPVRGALQLAILFTLEAKTLAYECGDIAERADYASNLTEHVMTNPKPFQEWRERILLRLERLYPYDEDDPMGDVVPREAMDPDFDFRPEMTQDLVQAYLNKLNPSTNQFLLTPEQMIEDGFKGKPYKFDMEEDKILRNDY